MIPLSEVTEVRKKKHLGFANSIEITVDGKREFFTSFLAREEAHRWVKNDTSTGWLLEVMMVGELGVAPACRLKDCAGLPVLESPCFPASGSHPGGQHLRAAQAADGPVAAVQ